MKETRGFRVDQLDVCSKDIALCTCCGWSGKVGVLNTIGGCTLLAGSRVPTGRCPTCSSLVFQTPASDRLVSRALQAMGELVECDEALRKGKSLAGSDYEAVLRNAKRLQKQAMKFLDMASPNMTDDERKTEPPN